MTESPVKNMVAFTEIYSVSPPAKKDILMKELQKVEPIKLLPCLSHDKLEVRLYAAAMLASSRKTPLKFDPWASKEIRKQQLERLNLDK